MADLVLVVPCYNESTRLDAEAFLGYTAPGLNVRFLFADDGSTDNTVEVLEAIRERAPDRIRVIALGANIGKGEAVRHGFLASLETAPDHIGFLDADLATPLEELSRFVDVLEHNPNIDLVLGSRVKLLGRTVERKAMRHYFGRVLATAVSNTLQMPIYDSQCGAKLFRVTPVLERTLLEPFFSTWLFDVEWLARLKVHYEADGVDVADRLYELPLNTWKDVHGSKTRVSDGFIAFYNLARIYRHYLAGRDDPGKHPRQGRMGGEWK